MTIQEEDDQQAALYLLAQFQSRLQRLAFAVLGQDASLPVEEVIAARTQQLSVPTQLADLERRLHQLARKSRVVEELLDLRRAAT